MMTRLAVRSGMPADELRATVRRWIDDHVPPDWRRAAERGGAAAIRAVRSRADYEAWYPVYGLSGLVVPTWPQEYGGLGLAPEEARVLDGELAAYNLGRLNPLGLNLAAPALFAHGTEAQRLRYLPPIVRNEEVWCQLFSEPGAGSDLASLATRAELRAGTETWAVTGQKVWSTWAHLADLGVLLARTDPDAPKRRGLTYFLIDLRQPGVTVRPLRHITGEHDFNEVFLDRAEVPDAQRVGRGAPGLGGRQRHPFRRASDGLGIRLGGSGPDRRFGSRSGGGQVGRAGGGGLARRRGRSGRPAGAHGRAGRGAGAGMDQPAGPGRAQGGAPSGSRELDRQGAPGRAQPAHPAAGGGSARRRRDGLARRGPRFGLARPTTARACRTRSRACCAVGPTPSRVARPRSTRRSWPSACSVCRGSPTRGGTRRGGRSLAIELEDRVEPGRSREPRGWSRRPSVPNAPGPAGGSGGLARVRPSRCGQRDERHHARGARVGVARARR